MVQVRKTLDRETSGEYPTLRLYADCIVRGERDPLIPMTQELLEGLIRDALNACDRMPAPSPESGTMAMIKNPLLSTAKLRKEIQSFCTEVNISSAFTEGEKWEAFLFHLTGAIAGEMVSGPGPWARYFMFMPNEQKLVGVVGFADEVNGHYAVMIEG